MRRWLAFGWVGAALLGSPAQGEAQSAKRLNPVVALHEQGKPVFGLYAPAARRGGEDTRTAADFARETVGYRQADYLFSGSMEDGVDEALPSFAAYVSALKGVGATAGSYPIFLKAPKIESGEQASRDIAKQLNAGASGIVMVHVESAEEVRQGLAAMRFRSRGGTRPDDVGSAPAYWGVSEAEYRQKADVWPLNPDGELVAWAIVETPAGLENVREIAAVEGLAAVLPGAGTLRGLFSTTGPDGQRQVDMESWEAAIQKVLAACKEFDVPCGYPANENDIEERMRQGFSVFVIGWGDGGFRTIETGRRVAGQHQHP